MNTAAQMFMGLIAVSHCAKDKKRDKIKIIDCIFFF